MSDLRKENETLRLELRGRNSQQTRAERIACAGRAARTFESLRHTDTNVSGDANVRFRDHFSEKYGRCIMVVDKTALIQGEIWTQSDVSDVDERTSFGKFSQAAGRPKPDECTFATPDSLEVRCSSHSEWNAYVERMFES